ncbi:replication initiator protein [Capybara microvirus Cap1_SP_99]|nr:replication initiator protein [Capybara microvirus Cap1_SP_99]
MISDSYICSSIPLRSYYYDCFRDKSIIRVARRENFGTSQLAQKEYTLRLYSELKRTYALHGRVYFYTLTYSDVNLPKYKGVSCVDYNHIRAMFHDFLYEQCERAHCAKIKYFVVTEYGDGKGSRGKGNNPHFHVIFMFQPHANVGKHLTGRKKSYMNIFFPPTPHQMLQYMRYYWQGNKITNVYHDGSFDVESYKRWQDLKYGFVKPGCLKGARNGAACGEVLPDNIDALGYVTKYVTKDTHKRRVETEIYRRIYGESYFDCANNLDLVYRCLRFSVEEKNKEFASEYEDIKGDVNYDGLSSIYDNLADVGKLEFSDSITEKLCSAYDNYLHSCSSRNVSPYFFTYCMNKGVRLLFPSLRDVQLNRIKHLFNKVFHSMLEEYQNECVKYYRNRYSTKVRISQHFGDSIVEDFREKALQNRELVYLLNINGKVNQKYYCGSYYYRKLFYKVVKGHDGSNKYVLNDFGIEYKMKTLDDNIERQFAKYKRMLVSVYNDCNLYSTFNDWRKKYGYDYGISFAGSFFSTLSSIGFSEITEDDLLKAAIFKIVYRDRYTDCVGINHVDYFTRYRDYYESYIIPHLVENYSSLTSLYDINMKTVCAYPLSDNVVLSPYSKLCDLFEALNDYIVYLRDIQWSNDYEERSRLRKLHKRSEVEEYLVANRYL